MEFQTPQFIEQKPKIVGPLTLGQFFYIAIGAGISFLAYQFFNLFLWIIISLAAFGISLALAFGKINGEPVSKIAAYFVKFSLRPKTYTWQRQTEQTTLNLSESDLLKIRKNISIGEKLKSLSLKVAIGKIFKPGPEIKKEGEEKYEVVTFITGEREKAKRVDYK